MKSIYFSVLMLAAASISTGVQANKVTGFHDSAAQINALLQSPAVAAALGNQAVMSMDAIGLRAADVARIWRIGTETCDIRVALLPTTPRQSGSISGITYAVEEPVLDCD